MKVYHYTSIETLALILKNKSIRFNRLDCVDDLEESIYGSGAQNVKLAQYAFVSCWTRDNIENLALWKMYTNNKGVRIALEENPFVVYPLNEKAYTYCRSFLDTGEDYFMLSVNNEAKLYDIKYVENQNDKIKKLINDCANSVTIDTENLGLYKDARWQFQKESRYKIILFPINAPIIQQNIKKSGNPYLNTLLGIFSSFGPSMLSQSPIKRTDFFVKLNETAINNIEVMMGPETSEAERFIVEKLLAEYPQSSISDSYFKGKIKSK